MEFSIHLNFLEEFLVLRLVPGSPTYARGSTGNSDELEVCALLCIRSLRRSSEVLSSTTFFLNSCSQSSISCDISLGTSFDSIFLFLVSVESCNGSHRSSSFVPPLPSDTGVSTSLFSETDSLLADVDSCDEDGDEADEGVVEEELVDKPRTTKWYAV